MSAGIYEIKIEQGASFSLKLKLKNSDQTPIDLTGHIFRGQIRATATREAVLASFTCTLENQSSTDTKGGVIVSLTDEQTALLPVPAQPTYAKVLGTYIYDIVSDAPSGEVIRWLSGTAIVSPGVTR